MSCSTNSDENNTGDDDSTQTGDDDTGDDDTLDPGADGDEDGYTAADDCDDDNPDVNPGAEEVCDDEDNDCDGDIDEDLTLFSFYVDSDGDGSGTSESVQDCGPSPGYARNDQDCNDQDAEVFPGAAEVEGDDRDNNCDGLGDVMPYVAGVSQARDDGDDALSARFSHPSSIVVDGDGVLYVADTDNHMIRRVSLAGTVSTVAGTGSHGYSGDGGPATEAQLFRPSGIWLDEASGDLYIADTQNQRIRKVSADGQISTLAGNGIPGFSGDGGPATEANLSFPADVVYDHDREEVYIADSKNNRIRKISADGNLTTVAGDGREGYEPNNHTATETSLSLPSGLALDTSGNILIADTENHAVRQLDHNGNIMTVVGTGETGSSEDVTATKADIRFPFGLAVDAEGTLYIAERRNHWVQKVSTGSILTTVAGVQEKPGFSGDGELATDAYLSYPVDVAVGPGGAVYIVDQYNNRIRKVETGKDPTIDTIAGSSTPGFSGDGGAPMDALFNFTAGVAVDSSGNTFVADSYNQRIRRIGADGVVSTFAGTGEEGDEGDGGFATNAQFTYPLGLAIDVAGNLYVADTFNCRIRKITASGVITTVAGRGYCPVCPLGDGGDATSASLMWPNDVAIDQAGNLYIADSGNNRVRRVAPDKTISTIAGDGAPADAGDGGLATGASLNFPNALALQEDLYLYVSDTANHRIRVVNLSDGTIDTAAGSGRAGFSGDGDAAVDARLEGPCGVAVNDSGYLFIADTANHRIRGVTPDGIIYTAAGAGWAGYDPDGLESTGDAINQPFKLAFDKNENLVFSDSWNAQVRVISFDAP